MPPLGGDINALRSMLASAATLPPPETDLHEETMRIPVSSNVDIDVHVTRHASTTDGPLVCWIHGGGCILRTPTWSEARAFAREFGAVVLSPQYRLAPESKFPTQAEDCYQVLSWAMTHAAELKADPRKGLIVGGTSSGGKLALVSAYRARNEHMTPPITGLLVQMPQVVAAEVVPEHYLPRYLSWEQCKDADCLGRESIGYYEGLSEPDKASTLHSPLLDPQGHAGLPPTFLQVCGWDPHRDDGLILEEALRAAGRTVDLVMYPGLPHGFFAFAPEMKASEKWRLDTVKGMRWLLNVQT